MSQSETHYMVLSEAKHVLRTTNETEESAVVIRDMVDDVSRILDSATGRRFDRRIETRYFDALPVSRGGPVDGSVLILDDDCQSLISVSVGGVSVPLSVLNLYPRNFKDYAGFIRRNDYGSWLNVSDPGDAIEVTGVWGFGGAWKNTGLSLAADHADNLAVFNIGGTTPLLEQEHILKIDTEYLRVTANAVNNGSVNVERGYNGSTATAHDNGTAVYIFQPNSNLRRAARRFLAWYEALESNPLFGSMSLGDVDIPIDISSMPKDISGLIADLARKGL